MRIHAILDDASRYVVAIEARHTEREVDMIALLVRALRRHGPRDSPRRTPARKATPRKAAATPAPTPQSSANERRPIGVFSNYSDAERAVDHLSDTGFPVQRVAIIGSDVKMVEQIIGRLNYGGAALRGAGSGAFAGVLIGCLAFTSITRPCLYPPPARMPMNSS